MTRPNERRHSTRTSSRVYNSLNENAMDPLMVSALVKKANKQLRKERRNPQPISYSGGRYALRKSRPTFVNEGADYSDDEENLMPLKQKSAKRRKAEMDSDEEDEDFVDQNHPVKRRKQIKNEDEEDDDEDEGEEDDDEENSDEEIQEEEEEEEKENSNRRSTRLRGRVSETNDDLTNSKRTSTSKNQNEKENDRSDTQVTDRAKRSLRRADTEEKEESKNDLEDVEDTAKSRESTVGPRTYELREKRTPMNTYSDRRPIRSVTVFARRKFANNNDNNNTRRKLREKRKTRYSSSSTESSDEETNAAKRDVKDEAKFQRRQMRSMHQSRQNLMPVNITEKDLANSKHLMKERLRQLGGNSCTDIDPMGIDRSVRFDQVGGLTTHLQSLKETVLFPLIYPEMFETFKITPPKGMLFYGSPGTGKTLVARALANECSQGERKVAFFMRKGADCLSKWIGESERQLRLLFDQAYSMRPSIIFFDEIDGLAPVRSSRQDQIHSSIVSTLLALIDGLDARGEVVVIGATNRLDSIDPALRRPGRFDRELRFSLPDKTARRTILDIHTKAWNEDNRPNEIEMEWLADKTSGYCGADLRALCTEAVLVAIRNKFPHIYLTSDKLAVNPNAIRVNQGHFITAMRNIVPACRRDVSIVSKQLNPRLACLMDTVIHEIFEKKIPLGYLKPQNVDNLYKTDLEKVVRALETPPSVPASRFLIHGDGNQGQTHYYLPVIANRLDHLVMHSISCVTLFSSVNPEESLNQMIHAAIRSTSNGTPTVLLLPDIDVLQSSLPTGCWNMLISRLESFVGFTALLMIATLRQTYETCSDDIKQLFGTSNVFEIFPPSQKQRTQYLREIIEKAYIEPIEFNPNDYPPIPKAVNTQPTRKLSPSELKGVEEKYENMLRHFRILLRDLLSKLLRDRRFNIFNLPVDKEDAEDYYEIIENPLCLTEMMAKLNRNEYTNKQQFLDDVILIRHNAIEYNPETDIQSRLIRNSAYALMDITEALFEEELDDDFVEKLEEMKKMIDEAKGAKGNSTASNIAIQLQRRTRRSILNGFKEDEVMVEIDKDEVVEREEDKNEGKNGRNKKSSSSEKIPEEVEENRVIANDPNNETSQDVPSVKSDSLPEVTNATEEAPIQIIATENAVNETSNIEEAVDPIFTIDKEKIENVIATAIDHTNNWSIPHLESLGAALTQRIERYTGLHDRSSLPMELIEIVNTFVL